MDIETPFNNRPKVWIELKYNVVGEYEFNKNVAAVSVESIRLQAIEFPQTLSKTYLRKLTDVKYEKGFVVKHQFGEIVDNYWIIFENKRYNVQEVVNLTGDYYLVVCHSMKNERTQ